MGRHEPRRGRTEPLRVGAGRRRPRTTPGRDPEHLPVETRELTVRTGSGRGLYDLTAACAGFAAEAADGGDGLLSIFVPHATAGLVIVEIGAGSDDDLMAALDRLLPRTEGAYRHRHGSPGHGADHVLPLLAPPSLTVPVIGGRLALGTWQSICLLDPNADNAVRTVRLNLLAG
ncbi:MAG TPA: YjbQ family protein [Candidatus Limnocylindrales bacterium]